ncbi:MAG: hypothetical protein O7F08_01855 [Deltaproteobacteria bacterium]|nr:hypothetical protein [Deltaproteobacteria bacterium]
MAETIYESESVQIVRASNGQGRGQRLEVNVNGGQITIDDPNEMEAVGAVLTAESLRQRSKLVARALNEGREPSAADELDDAIAEAARMRAVRLGEETKE